MAKHNLHYEGRFKRSDFFIPNVRISGSVYGIDLVIANVCYVDFRVFL